MKTTITFSFDATERFGSTQAEITQRAADTFFGDILTAKQMRLIEITDKTDARSIEESEHLKAEIEAIKQAKQSARYVVVDTAYKAAFPDFVLDIELPEGFLDISYSNDACPSFLNEELDVALFIDYANPNDREHPTSKRFSLIRMKDGEHLTGGENVGILDTDDLQEVIEKLDQLRAERQTSPSM